MSETNPKTQIETRDLNRTVPFSLAPDAAFCAALAEELDIRGVRKLRFDGELRPSGDSDLELNARLGVTVVQDCVVTLEPVTTRIDEDVTRLYLANMPDPEGEEAEMPEDDTGRNSGFPAPFLGHPPWATGLQTPFRGNGRSWRRDPRGSRVEPQ